MDTMQDRVILHADLNNFYASCECSRDMSIKDKPVAVCGSQEERHGIVLAKNYHAKAFGVSTGEAIWQAKQKCPDLVIVNPHYELYVKYSNLVRSIYLEYSNQVECMGMDECWIDISGRDMTIEKGTEIAHEIRERVKFETGLTISVGVSFNKIFAKLGSDMKKPDAVTVIPRDRFKEIVWPLDASEMLGVGRATKKELDRYCISTIGKLAAMPEDFMIRHFGKIGLQLLCYARGEDRSPVMNAGVKIPAKSFGHGTTTVKDLTNNEEVWRVMLELTQDIGSNLKTCGQKASGVSIMIRDNSLYTKQWQCKLTIPTQSAFAIASKAYELFLRSYKWENEIRSITVTAINLVDLNESVQLDLFTDYSKMERQEVLENCVESLRSRFGKNIILPAAILDNKKTQINPVKLIMPRGLSGTGAMV